MLIPSDFFPITESSQKGEPKEKTSLRIHQPILRLDLHQHIKCIQGVESALCDRQHGDNACKQKHDSVPVM